MPMPTGEDSPTPASTGQQHAQGSAAATQVAAATTVTPGPTMGSYEGGGYRDREPPPSYDGEDPEVSFRVYEKNVKLWEFETDIPQAKRGVKLLRSLSGVARLAVDEMTFEEITASDGVAQIMKRLREYFLPHLEVSLPRAFEAAVYCSQRTAKEGFSEYIARMDRNFTRLTKEGIQLPDSAQGYIIYRHAGLNESQDQRFLVWASGKYDRASVVSALRKLDKVIRDKGKSTYMTDDAGYQEETVLFEMDPVLKEFLEDNDESGEYVYLQEGDLNEVMDEQDVLEALASYQEIRQALKDQQKGRGYYGKGYGKNPFFSKGKGKGKVHMEQVKLRSRCWKCHQVGHHSRECRNEAKPKSNAPSGSNSNQSSSAASRSGFLVVSQPNASQKEESSFWLREVIRQNAEAQDMQSDAAYKAASAAFCGITTNAEHGVVDTAAEGGLIGSIALERLEQRLAQRGLRYKRLEKKSAAKGIGGNANVIAVVLLPVGIGGVNGLLETTVVEGDVPLLLPIKMMKCLRAVIDTDSLTFHMKAYDIKVAMHELASGHVTVDIMQFDNGEFKLPTGVPGCSEADFQLDSKSVMCTAANFAAMVAQSPPDLNSIAQKQTFADSNGSAVGTCEEPGQNLGRSSSPGPAGPRGCRLGATPLQESPEGLENHHGQSDHRPEVRRVPASGGRLGATLSILTWLAFGIQGGQAGGCVCRDHPECQEAYAVEEPEGSNNCSKHLHPPQEGTAWRRQQGSLVRILPTLSEPVGEPLQIFPTSNRHQGEQQDVERGPLGKPDGGTDDRGPAERGVDQPSNVAKGIAIAGASTRDEEGEGKGPQAGGTADDRAPEAGTNASHHGEGDAGTKGGSAGSSDQERSIDPHAGCSTKPTLSGKCQNQQCQCSLASTGGAMQLRQGSREAHSEEGRSTKREEVLEMHDEGMRVLPVGERNGGGCQDGQLQRGKQCPRSDEEEVQEPKEEPIRQCGQGSLRGGFRRPVDDGEWCPGRDTQTRRWLRRLQAGHGVKDGPFEASSNYELWLDGQWQKQEGQVPLREMRPTRVWVTWTKRGWLEEFFEEGKDKQFTAKQRKHIYPAMSSAGHLAAQSKHSNSKQHTVSEVFSPPRMSSEAKKQGLQAGSSFDLKTGWNLTDPSQRRKMWKQLEEEDPEFVMVCPPCKAFSTLQGLNLGKMEWEKAVMLIQTGVECLEIAAGVIKRQMRKGKYFLFEHPEFARSWSEKSIQEIEEQDEVIRTRCDMCAFGLQVTEGGYNKKGTGLMTNSEEVAKMVSRQCPQNHPHVQLIGGIAHKAEKYPEAFCRAVITGLKKQLKKDGSLWILAQEGEEEEEELFPVPPAEGVAEDSIEVAGEKEDDRELTAQEKRALEKLHRGLGHPQLRELVRFMKAARVKPEVIRWAWKNFKCEVCEARPRPKTVRPAAIPKTYQPGKVLGIDLIFLPGLGGQGLLPALSMVDYGSNYQMVELLPNKDPEEVWNAMWRCWIRTFGTPEVIVCDAGKEFTAEFTVKASASGMVVHQIGARAPWQNGRVERHGAHFKELMDKARAEVVVTSTDELRLLLQEVEQAKNRFSNRSGFSPVQRQIGQWPRCPGEILSDDGIDPALIAGSMVDDLERLHEMRRIAQKAFVETNARKAITRTLNSRGRTVAEFKPGDLVYVFRVHRQRKRRDGGQDLADQARNKPTWVGPGTVIMEEGANLWISVWGQLWKAAKEQCRPATSSEKEGVEVIWKECQELVEEYKKSSKKTGYKDLTEEPWPEEEEDPEESEERPREVRFVPEEDDGYSPESPADEEEVRNWRRRASHESRMTVDEPERENSGLAPESIDSSNSITSEEPLTATAPTEENRTAESQPAEPTASPQTYDEQLRRSIEQSNRLDGHPSGPIRGWRRQEVEGRGPYMWEMFLEAEGEVEDNDEEERLRKLQKVLKQPKQKKDGDYWSVDLESGTVTKHHRRKRKAMFHPKDDPDMPVKIHQITEQRQTCLIFKENMPTEHLKDEWKGPRAGKSRSMWWKGTTTFVLKEKIPEEEKEALHVLMAEKRRTEEVNMKAESAQDLQEWKLADKAEWDKVAQSGAVRVLSVEESKKVKEDLGKAGKTDRILPTKVARRYKPSEQPGLPASKKSRLCLRGDLDPDILELEKFSPTVNTMNLAVMMQTAANQNMLIQIADFKNAFCQSGPLKRPNGKLYFRQPSEGIEGLDPEQIVEIVNGVYGLVDAPKHWRECLTTFLSEKMGYIQSTLDPCIYKLYHEGKLEGMIAIEVDDLLMMGHQKHLERLETLKKSFNFGKWVTLKETEEGAAFNGRRLRQLSDGEVQVDMEKFVSERLQEVKLEKGRASQRKSEVDEKERSACRAVCGAMNWLSKEGRPDMAGPASLFSSKLSTMTIEDVLAMNETVRNIKKDPSLTIRLQPLKDMKFCVVSDASFGNQGLHSQGGQMILTHEDGLQHNMKVKTNVLCWRSGRIQRVVNSTLAAETQSLSRGLGDLLWVMVLFEELEQEHFKLRDWSERLSGREVMALASNNSSERLKGSLAVVDAKSLYDQLCKDSIGGSDKRTAIEIQIIREDLKSLSGKMRWVDHPAMVADGLTKVKGSNAPLYNVLKTGMFQLTAEEEHMQARSTAKQQGQKAHDIRKFGINKNVGSCEIDVKNEPCIDSKHEVSDPDSPWDDGPNMRGP